MSNNPSPAPQTETTQQPQDKEIQVANLQLQLANARSNAEYNASPAGQIQRQFESMQRCAKPYAESTIVPTSYRGNIGNCIIALDLAYRMNLPAMAVMQNLYVVNGNPSWSSKFLVACINTCGRFTNIRYKKRNLGKLGKVKYNDTVWDPDKKAKTTVVKEFDASGLENWECIAYCSEKATGEVLESDPVSIEMAIKEGWYTKTGSKWVTMPMLMLSYRAAAFWQRMYAPEMSMGFRTREEEEDIQDVEYEEVENLSEVIPTVKAKAKPSTSSVEEAKEKLRNRDNAAAAEPAAHGNASNTTQSSMFDMP